MFEKDFFSSSRTPRHENFSGAGVGINISGQDWLGLGEIFGSMAEGTALCGAKPVCVSTAADDNCAQKMKAFNDCNIQGVALMQQQLAAQTDATKRKDEAESKKRTTMIVVISLVSIAAVVITVLLLRNKEA